MIENKSIPLVIITSLVVKECEDNWGIQNFGTWIVEDRILEFTGLSDIYGKIKDCNSFKKIEFEIPDEHITALVLKGNTEDMKPHQLEIIAHLLSKERCKINFILIHPGGGGKFEDDPSTLAPEHRGICNDSPSRDDININEIAFSLNKIEKTKVPFFNYSLGRGTGKTKDLGRWIEEIAKAIKGKNYKDADENLNELCKLLKKYVDSNYDEEILKKKPKPCLVFKIIENVPAFFLPIFIDLNGLSELSIKGPYYQKERMLKEFLIDMIKGKEPQYYTKKLGEARFLIFGKTFENLDEHWAKFKDANLKGTLLKYPELQTGFMEAFGYKTEPEIKELKDYDENLKEVPTFMLLDFFRYLDLLIEKGHKPEEITYADVSNILDNYYDSFMNWFKKMNLSFSKLMSELNKG